MSRYADMRARVKAYFLWLDDCLMAGPCPEDPAGEWAVAQYAIGMCNAAEVFEVTLGDGLVAERYLVHRPRNPVVDFVARMTPVTTPKERP